MSESSVAQQKPVKSIDAKMAKILGMVSRVPKTGYNSFHKYHYATESDVSDALRKFLSEHNIAIGVNILEVVDMNSGAKAMVRVKIEIIFTDCDSGEIIVRGGWGFGQDTGEKGYYKAVSGGVKYILMKNFLMSTGDDPEDDSSERANQNHGSFKEPQRPANPAPRGNPQAGNAAPKASAPAPHANQTPTNPQLSRLFALAGNANWTNDDVKHFMQKSFKKDSTRTLTQKEYEIICDFITKNKKLDQRERAAGEAAHHDDTPPPAFEDIPPQDQEALDRLPL